MFTSFTCPQFSSSCSIIIIIYLVIIEAFNSKNNTFFVLCCCCCCGRNRLSDILLIYVLYSHSVNHHCIFVLYHFCIVLWGHHDLVLYTVYYCLEPVICVVGQNVPIWPSIMSQIGNCLFLYKNKAELVLCFSCSLVFEE